MTIEEGLATYLNARAGLTALVSNRIYPLMVPQDKDLYPAVTYQVISVQSDIAHSGPTGLRRMRIQVNAWARKYESMLAVRDQLFDALTGFHGLWGTIKVGTCQEAGERDLYEPSAGLSEARLYGRGMDFMVWHDEPVPTYA